MAGPITAPLIDAVRAAPSVTIYDNATPCCDTATITHVCTEERTSQDLGKGK
jgi:hypothetical protein